MDVPTSTATVAPADSGSFERALEVEEQEPTADYKKHPVAFWLVFISLCLCCFLSALDLTCIGTILPTIVEDLQGTDYVWVGSSFALASTAVLPYTGGLADCFGRRPIMILWLSVFALGSGLCGGAKSMPWLIAGRTVQGLGGGGILVMSEIITADLVPLRDRGTYQSVIGAVWAVASAIGPPIGGALASANAWRWLFYMQLPLTGIAMGFVACFLNLKVPKMSFREKLSKVDWIGTGLVVGSSTSMILAITWAGTQYAWDSIQVLVPLLTGFLGLFGFMLYEARIAVEPITPIGLISNVSSVVSFIAVFLHGIILSALVYYLPTYFQAAHDASAVQAGVDILPAAFMIAPFAVICALTTSATGRYLPQNYISWIVTIVGLGVLTLLHADSSRAMALGVQVPVAIGIGALFAAPLFAVLAPIPVSLNAKALSLFSFVRSFGVAWGITVGNTVLQNRLKKNLPPGFLAAYPEGISISYAIVPLIKNLPEPLRSQIRAAFADSIRIIWIVCIGLAGGGLLMSFLIKEIKLERVVDASWGFVDRNPRNQSAATSATYPRDNNVIDLQKLTQVAPACDIIQISGTPEKLSDGYAGPRALSTATISQNGTDDGTGTEKKDSELP